MIGELEARDLETSEEMACHLTPADVARRWRMSPRTLERWRARRKGPPWLRLRGRIRYRHADVLAYEREHLVIPGGGAASDSGGAL